MIVWRFIFIKLNSTILDSFQKLQLDYSSTKNINDGKFKMKLQIFTPIFIVKESLKKISLNYLNTLTSIYVFVII